tara:strand:+ start:912 stop:1085 length:174 start_codon:yes stop_codon:yes gene_type:complete
MIKYNTEELTAAYAALDHMLRWESADLDFNTDEIERAIELLETAMASARDGRVAHKR